MRITGTSPPLKPALSLSKKSSQIRASTRSIMKPWTALEPGNIEHKIYAPGEGLVFIKELKEKTVEVELIDINFDDIPDFDIPQCN